MSEANSPQFRHIRAFENIKEDHYKISPVYLQRQYGTLPMYPLWGLLKFGGAQGGQKKAKRAFFTLFDFLIY